MCILSTRLNSSAEGVRYFPIRDPLDNSPNHVYPGTALGIPSGILQTTALTVSILGLSRGSHQGSSGQQPQACLSWDCPVDPIRDPPDNSPYRVCPGTVLGIPSGILRTTAPTVSILGLPWGSHQGSSGQQPKPCLSWDCPVDPIRDPPDNSPYRVCPGTVLGVPCIGNPRHSSTYATYVLTILGWSKVSGMSGQYPPHVGNTGHHPQDYCTSTKKEQLYILDIAS